MYWDTPEPLSVEAFQRSSGVESVVVPDGADSVGSVGAFVSTRSVTVAGAV